MVMPVGFFARKIHESDLNQAVWPWWVLALTYYVAGCLMHLRFSLWLVRQRAMLFGPMAFADLMPGLVITAVVGLVLWIARGLKSSPQPRLTLAFWSLWLAAVVLIDHYLTFSINEHFHYPQYAILALLVARAIDPRRTGGYAGRVLFWTALMGIGDELLQYLWITISYSDYLDFNDFVVNLVAAAAGVLLYYGPAIRGSRSGAKRAPVLELVVAGAILLVVLVGFQTGRLVQSPTEKIPAGGIVLLADGNRRLYLQRGPDYYGSWQVGPRHGRYYVMPPLPAVLIMVLVGLTFAGYTRLRSPSTSVPQ